MHQSAVEFIVSLDHELQWSPIFSNLVPWNLQKWSIDLHLPDNLKNKVLLDLPEKGLDVQSGEILAIVNQPTYNGWRM